MPDTSLREVASRICGLRQLTLDDFLGQGAFKQAFRATSAEGATVALKVAVTSDSLQPRLDRETRALSECQHPSIASLLDSFPFKTDQGKYWITIEEYIAGGTLEQRLATGVMDGPAVLSTILPLAEALAHLQQKQLVHRDIKPANILFRTTGEPVLTDFGLVRVLGQSSLTHDFVGMGPGTPLYAAPEQLLNEKAEIDWRTDQFALALVGCRCLFGVHPFAPLESPQDAVQMVQQRATLQSDMKARLIDAGFPALVRALEPWAVGRFRWPDQFIAELRRPGGA